VNKLSTGDSLRAGRMSKHEFTIGISNAIQIRNLHSIRCLCRNESCSGDIFVAKEDKCVGTIYESFLVCHMEIMLIDFSSKVLAYHRCLSITYEIKNSRRCIRLRVDV
jgi:hypothetical protein